MQSNGGGVEERKKERRKLVGGVQSKSLRGRQCIEMKGLCMRGSFASRHRGTTNPCVKAI